MDSGTLEPTVHHQNFSQPLCCRRGMEKFWKVLPPSVKKPSYPHLHPSPIVPSLLCQWLGNTLPLWHTCHWWIWQEEHTAELQDEWSLWRRPLFSFCSGQWQFSVELITVRKSLAVLGQHTGYLSVAVLIVKIRHQPFLFWSIFKVQISPFKSVSFHSAEYSWDPQILT